jgi:hypothetical protein
MEHDIASQGTGRNESARRRYEFPSAHQHPAQRFGFFILPAESAFVIGLAIPESAMPDI